MVRTVSLRTRVLGVAAAGALAFANASPDAVHVLDVDLAPLIDAVAGERARFAVEVPHRADLSAGRWSRVGDGRTWTYAVRIPGAVTMSLQASRVRLPAGAMLTVEGGGDRHDYDAADVAPGALWSRVVRGDTLAITVAAPIEVADSVVLEIASLQAGYRALVPGLRDHPRLARARPAAAPDAAPTDGAPPVAAANDSCVQDYACRAAASNQEASAATVALLVRNQYMCTGTLLNDVPGSGTPWVLTARHCQGGAEPGGDPAAAQGLTVYWGAVGRCGDLLPSFFSASAATQTGATTVVEQQDAWLVRLSAPPAWSGATWAGFDASGARVTGGFGIHHANGRSQQYVEWFGDAAVARRTTNAYTGDVLRVANAFGNVGFGGSGSALFDATGRAVGVLSRARFEGGDPTGYGTCPRVPPVPPTEQEWAAEYVDLAALWNSAGDRSSTTNPATLKSALDPAGTGRTRVDARLPPPVVTLTQTAAVPDSGIRVGSLVHLDWTARFADGCRAGGNTGGGAWSGALPTAGRRSVTEATPGDYTYSITCTRGDTSTTRSLQLYYAPAAYIVQLATSPTTIWADEPADIVWNSDAPACAATGGLAGDGWAGPRPPSGRLPVPANVTTATRYSLTCGAAGNERTAWLDVARVTPWAEIQVMSGQPRVRVGQSVRLRAAGGGRTCTASGGRPGDGWAGVVVEPGAGYWRTLTSLTPAVLDYDFTCVGGTQTVAARRRVEFVDEPPAATLTALRPRETVIPSGPIVIPSTQPNLRYEANVAPCRIDFAGPESGTRLEPTDIVSGVVLDLQNVPGRYIYTLTCGSGIETASSTATIDWVPPGPEVRVSSSAVGGVALLDEGTRLGWWSNVAPCVASGGGPDDGWAGPRAQSGFTTVRPSRVGTYTYALACGPPGAEVRAETTVRFELALPEIMSFAADPAVVQPGATVVLSWTASRATACRGTGGLAGDGWAGASLDFRSGQRTVTSPLPGSIAYGLECTNTNGRATREVVVTYQGAPRASVTLTGPATAAAGRPFELAWSATNATSCTAFGGAPTDGWAGTRGPDGRATVTAPTWGRMGYQMTCGDSPVATHVVEVAPPSPPSASLAASPTRIPLGATTTLTWTSANAVACVGGGTDPAWSGSRPTAGSLAVRPGAAGTITYTIACRSASFAEAQASAQVTVTAPTTTASLQASPSSVSVGDTFTLTWSSTGAASCTATGGVAGDGWTGELAPVGSRSIAASAVGSVVYGVRCSGDGGSADARTTVSVASRPAASPPTDGGSGGGGALDPRTLLGLLALAALARRRRR